MIKITEISEQQINAALQALNNEIESLRSQSKMTDSKQVNSDWDATSGPAQILNKPHLAPVATSGSYYDLKDRPSDIGGSFTQVNSDWAETRGVAAILNKPNLTTVATTGNYNDLINKPTIPTHTSQLTNNSDFTTKSYVDNTVNALENQLATVATTGNYNDLNNKPTIPTVDNSVASGNMNAVTSNAVALAISEGIKRKWTETSAPVTGTNASNITWTCIETNGGLKICFGRATSVRSSSPTGNIFYSSGADEQWYYPSNFFTATPTCLMEASGSSQWILTYTQPQGADKTKTKKVCPACSSAFTNLTIYYDIAAFGV